MLFILSKKLFSFPRYSSFFYVCLPFFFPLSIITLENNRRWIIKVYDVINCLNKNLVTYFVWYLEKKKRYDLENLSIDRVLNKEHFYGKIMHKKEHPKLVPEPFIILVNNPKQLIHSRNSFEIKISWKRIIKSP